MSKRKRIGSRQRRKDRRVRRGLPESTPPVPLTAEQLADIAIGVDFILHGPGGP